VYYRLGRLSDEETLLRDTVPHAEQVLPPGDQLLQTARENLKEIAGE